MDAHLECVESLIDFLLAHSKSSIKFEQIDALVLSIFYSEACLVHLTQPGQRIDAKIWSISNKIMSLFDKFAAFDETSAYKSTLFKILKFLLYLIQNVKDSKCIVMLWKIMSKLLFKWKILVPSTSKQTNVLRKITSIFSNDQKVQ